MKCFWTASILFAFMSVVIECITVYGVYKLCEANFAFSDDWQYLVTFAACVSTAVFFCLTLRYITEWFLDGESRVARIYWIAQDILTIEASNKTLSKLTVLLLVLSIATTSCTSSSTEESNKVPTIFYEEYLDFKYDGTLLFGYTEYATETPTRTYWVKVDDKQYKVSRHVYNLLNSDAHFVDIFKCKVVNTDSLDIYGLQLGGFYNHL